MAARGLWYARVALHVAIRLRRGATPNRKNRSNPAYAMKGRGRFSWGRRSHSCRCKLLSLVVATCVETIADAEQQLNHAEYSAYQSKGGRSECGYNTNYLVIVARVSSRMHARVSSDAPAVYST